MSVLNYFNVAANFLITSMKSKSLYDIYFWEWYKLVANFRKDRYKNNFENVLMEIDFKPKFFFK